MTDHASRILRDPARLAALKRLRSLLREAAPTVQRVARLSARALHASRVVLSMVERDREVLWSASDEPPPAPAHPAAPLFHALCRPVVIHGTPWAVSNARSQPRLRMNPVVDRGDAAAFLAVPLRAPDGPVVGGLVALDRRGREWTAQEIAALEDGAAQLEEAMALRAERTRHRQREDWSHRRERHFRALVEQGTDVMLMLDDDGAMEYVNPAVQRVLGYAPDSLRGDDLLGLVHPADRESSRQTVDDALRTPGRVLRARPRLHHRDGSWRTLAMSCRVVDAGAGRPRVLVTLRDAPERLQTEDSLRFLVDAGALLASSLDVETTLTSLATLAVPTLADYCIVDVHESGDPHRIEIAGVDPERAARIREVFTERSGPGDGSGVRTVRNTGRAQLIPNVRAVPGDEDERGRISRLAGLGAHSLMIVPLHARNDVLGTVTLIGDAMRRFSGRDLALAEALMRHAALALENAFLYQQAQRASRDRDEVLATVSHDLKNALSVVSMSARIVEGRARATEKDQALGRHAELIRRSVEQMDRLILDLLDAARLETRTLSLNREPCEVEPLLREVADLYRPLVARKSLHLECHTATGLPRVDADRNRLLQVFSNLLSNAIKFTPTGGRIRITAEAAGGDIRFSVSDTGRGIPREDLPHVFERYWQAGRRRGNGVGLGLAITKGIVEAHGGQVQVESTPGSGTTFSFTIRAARGRGGRLAPAV